MAVWYRISNLLLRYFIWDWGDAPTEVATALLEDLGWIPSTHCGLQPVLTLVPEDMISFFIFCGHQAHMWSIDMYATKVCIHMKRKIKIKKILTYTLKNSVNLV